MKKLHSVNHVAVGDHVITRSGGPLHMRRMTGIARAIDPHYGVLLVDERGDYPRGGWFQPSELVVQQGSDEGLVAA